MYRASLASRGKNYVKSHIHVLTRRLEIGDSQYQRLSTLDDIYWVDWKCGNGKRSQNYRRGKCWIDLLFPKGYICL